ncbi:hypothetical protein ACJMK2_007347 [Sinanodonta woodiana]|uniref:Uncharacterized protein n=1 Tax=Sinanodonta woodiana TaxID=1069815 RepID=A0ABD3VJJ7_SINWO
MGVLREWSVISVWCLCKLLCYLWKSITRRKQGSDIVKMDISKIAKNLVKSVATGEMAAIHTFWENQPCVITFFRRFG